MSEARPHSFRARRRSGIALGTALLLAFAPAPALAQPAQPAGVVGQPVALSYSYRHFDGVMLDTIVLTAESAAFETDTLGAWIPITESAPPAGFNFQHGRLKRVFVTLWPFAGPGPGASETSWLAYQQAAARLLGPATTVEDGVASGTIGGTPSFASWPTREVSFTAAATTAETARAERHVVAAEGTRGVMIILAGPAADVATAEGDFRFLLARLERRQPAPAAAQN